MDRSVLISRLKNMRKQSYLNLSSNHKYAVVGIGSHSMVNIYPILQYYRLPIKYIVVRSDKNALKITKNFHGITGTTKLADVLDDPEIKGIFISTSPGAHFEIATQALASGKEVFVEKPPCSTISELQGLIETSQKTGHACFVGLQKRYAPCNVLLKKKMKNVRSYTYRFVTGAYPEGDPVLELFIHPVDLCAWLFGEAEVLSDNHLITKAGRTHFLHLKHTNGTIGSLELSTHSNWDFSVEQLEVNTEEGIFKMKDSVELSFLPLRSTFLGVPMEKVVGKRPTEEFLVKRDTFSSTLSTNHLYQSGHFFVLSAFIDWCEHKKSGNNSSPFALLNTYKILNSIQ